MGDVIGWLEEQWKQKGFRIFAIFTAVLTVIMAVEFYLFAYGMLKICRYLILLWVLFGVAWIDRQSKRIPNQAVLSLLIIRTVILLMECLVYREYWLSIVIDAGSGFLFGGGMFLFCYLITRGGVGAGDVKLFAALGYQLGAGAIFTTIFLTVVIAAVYCLVALVRKKTGMKQEIAFAPFIFAGTVLTMMLGV